MTPWNTDPSVGMYASGTEAILLLTVNSKQNLLCQYNHDLWPSSYSNRFCSGCRGAGGGGAYVWCVDAGGCWFSGLPVTGVGPANASLFFALLYLTAIIFRYSLFERFRRQHYAGRVGVEGG